MGYIEDAARFNKIGTKHICLQLRQAVVTAVDGDKLTIDTGDDIIDDVTKLASYVQPAPDDVVWLIVNGPDYLVIGKQ